jgi:hypothetical protein
MVVIYLNLEEPVIRVLTCEHALIEFKFAFDMMKSDILYIKNTQPFHSLWGALQRAPNVLVGKLKPAALSPHPRTPKVTHCLLRRFCRKNL